MFLPTPNWSGEVSIDSGGDGQVRWTGEPLFAGDSVTLKFQTPQRPIVLSYGQAHGPNGYENTFAGGELRAPGVPLKVALQSVAFSGATNFGIEADPGDPVYPTGPQYFDGNGNGIVDDVGDRRLPVGFVRNGHISVAATWLLAPGYSPTGYVEVRADGPGSHDLGWTSVSVQGGLLVLQTTMLAEPLADYIDYNEDFRLTWQFRTAAIPVPQSAGQSTDPLYATLNTPGITGPIFRTVVHISTEASVGAKEDAVVRDRTWGVFTGLNVRKAPAALMAVAGGVVAGPREMYYYKEWDTKVATTKGLLETRDGQCTAWVKIFIDTLAVNRPGIVDVNNLMFIRSLDAAEGMLINKWDIGQASQAGVYPWRNYFKFLPPDQLHYKKVNGEWVYAWTLDAQGKEKADWTDDKSGAGGQGPVVNPKSDFDVHVVAFVDNRIYDVSYGKDFANSDAWATDSLQGYYRNGGTVLAPYLNIREAKPAPGKMYDIIDDTARYKGYKG